MDITEQLKKIHTQGGRTMAFIDLQGVIIDKNPQTPIEFSKVVSDMLMAELEKGVDHE